MKIFAKLSLLTFTLIASSASAALDPYNLPTEVPTELQEQLAWGLINRNIPIIEQALDAGAQVETVFDAIADAPFFPESGCYYPAGWISPFRALTYKSKGVFEAGKNISAMCAEMDEFSRCAEFLIKKGMSIDTRIFQFDMWGDELSFRKAYMHNAEHCRFGKNLPEEVVNYGKDMILRIQEAIKAYQPKSSSEIKQEAYDAQQVRLLAIKNLPVAPADLQEKLLWGLLNLDPKVTEEALIAGATIGDEYYAVDECYSHNKSGTPYAFVLFTLCENNVLSEFAQRVKKDEPIALVYLAQFARTVRMAHGVVALLIKHGFSVDIDMGWPFGTIRRMLNPETQRNAPHHDDEPEYMQEYKSYITLLFEHLHILIDKYQPAIQQSLSTDDSEMPLIIDAEEDSRP